MRLHELPLRQPAAVIAVDWNQLSATEAQRLRELGLEEGAAIEALHRGGLFGRGPLACRIGRMTVAMRRSHAQCIEVQQAAHAGGEAAAA